MISVNKSVSRNANMQLKSSWFIRLYHKPVFEKSHEAEIANSCFRTFRHSVNQLCQHVGDALPIGF